MNVGLPGTGIGGLFYLLTAFTILFSELVVTVQGNSSQKRWKVVGEQVGITVSMIIMAVITNIGISTYLIKTTPLRYYPTENVSLKVLQLYQHHPLLVPITLLFLMLLFVQMGYILVRYRNRAL